MDKRNNIITTLNTRYQIEQEIADLLEVQSEEEFTARVERIVAGGKPVVSVLLNNLKKRMTPQKINVLGIIAAHYPDREYLLNRLYDLIADPAQSDRCRLAAIVIMERDLGEEVDPSLLALIDPQLLVRESVHEMLTKAHADPLVLTDYLNSLAEQPEDVFEGVIETIVSIGQEKAVLVLCALAQDESAALAELAIHALGRVDHPDAVRALQTLRELLDPSRLPLCERNLRKLAFKGIPIEPLPPVDAAWRTLVNPPDGQGNRVVWFFHPNTETGEQFFWSVSLGIDEGILAVYGNAHVLPELLPPAAPRGYIHSLSPEENLTLYMLETDFDYGRRLVRQGARHTVARGQSLPIEYRLLSMSLWSYALADEQVALPPRLDPDKARALVDESVTLFDHVAFHSWFAYGSPVIDQAFKLLRRSLVRPQESLGRSAKQLARVYYDAQAVARLQSQLEAGAEWLFIAGEEHLAQVALAAADTLTEIMPDQHPFTLRMAERGIETVIEQLYQHKIS